MSDQVNCPNCSSNEYSVETTSIDKNTGLKFGIGGLLLGIVLGTIGLFFIISGIATWGKPLVSGKGPLYAIGLGVLFNFWGVPMILEFLRKGNVELHSYKCKNCGRGWNLLGKNGDPSTIESLIKQAKDEDLAIRKPAFSVLMNIYDIRSKDTLIKGLEDKDAEIRSFAVARLGNIEDPDVIELLARALEDEKKSV